MLLWSTQDFVVTKLVGFNRLNDRYTLLVEGHVIVCSLNNGHCTTQEREDIIYCFVYG